MSLHITFARLCSQCEGAFLVESPSSPRAFCSAACRGLFRRQPAAARFWAKVDRSAGCWPWTGNYIGIGYPKFQVAPGVHVSAHRYAWELLRGPVPDGLWVLHDCPGGDNRLCVNPGHLFLGTPGDNTRDCIRKGRWNRGGIRNGPKPASQGERNANAKLTADDVRAIRGLVGVLFYREIAAMYGVSTGLIGHIASGRAWRHV